MVFGHNTNVKLGSMTFHVQTEDRGVVHAVIDTAVYFHGRVLHRRTNRYFDLIPLDEAREQALKLRLDNQHQTVVAEIRSGTLAFSVPAPADLPSQDTGLVRAPCSGQCFAPEPPRLLLELGNAKSWLSGKHAKLQVAVRQAGGMPVPGVQVHVELEGGASRGSHHAETNAQGEALIEFELPRLTKAETALVISAENQTARGHLRFALRAKPRVGSM